MSGDYRRISIFPFWSFYIGFPLFCWTIAVLESQSKPSPFWTPSFPFLRQILLCFFLCHTFPFRESISFGSRVELQCPSRPPSSYFFMSSPSRVFLSLFDTDCYRRHRGHFFLPCSPPSETDFLPTTPFFPLTLHCPAWTDLPKERDSSFC